jgi:hypothetical protein
MTDDAARAELERRVAERLHAAYVDAQRLIDTPGGGKWLWLAVAREAIAMATRVVRADREATGIGLHDWQCFQGDPEMGLALLNRLREPTTIDLSAAGEES